MKTDALTEKRKAQVFVTAIIVLAIVLSLGAALLFHSRSLRDVTRLQVDTERAYSLAKSGMGIGEAMIYSPGPCGSPIIPVHKQYYMSSGTINIDIVPAQGILTSTGKMDKSMRVLVKTFAPYTGQINLPQWAKVYSFDATYFSSSFSDSKPTPDGGYVILGAVQQSIVSDNDFFLIKTNSKGDIEWARIGDTVLSESPQFVLPITDGYIIGGTVPDGATNNLFLLKTNSQGYVGPTYPGTWERTYGVSMANETFNSLQQYSSGYLIIGSAPGGITLTDCLVIKTDLDGQKVWGYRYAYSMSSESCTCGQEIGGYYVLGGQDLLSGWDNFFIKLNPNDGTYANVSKKWGSLFSGETVLTLQESSDSKYVFGGLIRPAPTYTRSLYLLKTNTDGSRDWSKTYVYSWSDSFATFQRTADGGYIIGGTTGANLLRGADFLLVKTDDQGQVLWDKAYGGSLTEGNMRFIKEVADGYVFGGTTTSWGSVINPSFLLVKTDTQGNINCCDGFAVDVSVSVGSNTFDTSTVATGPSTAGDYNDSSPSQSFASGNYTSNYTFVCPSY